MESNAKYLKRKVKAGTIELDAETCTLIVNYEVEATVLGDTGEAIVAERKSNQKRIRLRALDEHTDVSRLVDEILERCKLIHESKRPLVERLLRDLQDQQAQGAPVRGARAAASADEPVAGSEVARLERLGEYIDGCYEGTAQAVRATGLLLQLAREPAQLEALVHDERLLGCLTRLLGDEGKACADLSLNAASVLYALSAFSDFHPQLLGAKVGSLLMDVVDLEIKRHALRERDRAAAPASEAPAEARRARAAGKASERLLYVCLHLLLNLSEDVHTERKMSAHGLVPMLVALLARQNADLLILCFAFLKKLSAFSENAEQMAKARLADKLVAFVPNRHDGVLEQALRLAHNLALHHRCAAQLGRAGLSAKLLSLLRKGRHRLLAVRLLCALSARDDERPKMTASVPMLVGTVINTPDPALIPPEVLALLVNLATNLDNARALARARGALRSFVALGCAAQQPLALKLLRNLALHAGEAHCEELARAHGAELLALPAAAASADVQLEALGLLADLPLSALGDGGAELLEASGALGVAAAALDAHSGAEDDAVLEAARFLAAAAGHAGCAALLGADCELLGLLCGALSAWEEEDEIVLAATHALLRLMAGSREAREWLLAESELVSQLLDLLSDKCAPIRDLAAAALDVVALHDEAGEWRALIRARRFGSHNAEWLAAVEEDDVERYQEEMAIHRALGKAAAAVHDVSELDELPEDAPPGAAELARERLRLELDGAGGEGEEGYGSEYGLDARSPGQLASSARAFGALSEEAYLGLAGEVGSYGDESAGEEGEGEGEDVGDQVDARDEYDL